MNPKRRPQQLDQCQDFWGLDHWVDTHPDQFTLEQVYKRMVEINQGPPEASQLQLCAKTDSYWIAGIGFIHLAQMRGELNLEYNQTYQTALIGLTPALQMPLMRADKHLRQKLVWLTLAQEGNQGLSLAKCDNSATRPAGTMGWSRTLKTCIDEGLIERDQLLDTLLQMLAADFPATRAGWYSRTLRMLAMTPNEAASRQAPLCALLTSPITATTTLAVNELAKTSHTNQLDTTLFLHHCPGALTGTKTNAVGVLKILLDNLNAINPNQIQPLLDLALTFPHPQVQRLALDLAEQSLKAKLIEPTQLTQLLAQTQLDPLTQPTAQKLQATLTTPTPPRPNKHQHSKTHPKTQRTNAVTNHNPTHPNNQTNPHNQPQPIRANNPNSPRRKTRPQLRTTTQLPSHHPNPTHPTPNQTSHTPSQRQTQTKTNNRTSPTTSPQPPNHNPKTTSLNPQQPRNTNTNPNAPKNQRNRRPTKKPPNLPTPRHPHPQRRNHKPTNPSTTHPTKHHHQPTPSRPNPSPTTPKPQPPRHPNRPKPTKPTQPQTTPQPNQTNNPSPKRHPSQTSPKIPKHHNHHMGRPTSLQPTHRHTQNQKQHPHLRLLAPPNKHPHPTHKPTTNPPNRHHQHRHRH